MKTLEKFLSYLLISAGIFFAGCTPEQNITPVQLFEASEELEPNERIEVAGDLLVDSKSPTKMPDSGSAAVAEKATPLKDLVCGMNVDPKSASTLRMQYKGETYYFCSMHCKKSFESNPEKYISKKSTPAAKKKAKDIVCGMDVDPNAAGTLKSAYKGKAYYFCSEMCKKSFEANPGQFVHKMADSK